MDDKCRCTGLKGTMRRPHERQVCPLLSFRLPCDSCAT
jgi:hypothetical protein